ncbi:alpha-L-fucosidase [Aestuariimicrobium ganziense]|uniref:alpha-L-fucosidase n=1 Tax=Aestuariimicrobium ganziense TaxID=2773677 RepID=UPI0019456BC2|nr:alpha-L-fucosidase [Aestuariimicrobium ganziense]
MTSALPDVTTPHPRFDRSAAWRADRFGMFIHWGAYAVPARGEWVRSIERITFEDYEPEIEAFVPTEVDFDAWAHLAWNAGMRYAVMTAKHHDGYCLFDSALTDYTTVKRGPKRDLVAGFIDAFRRRGLKVGLYFSVIDWAHPDFPHFGDRQHPMRDNEAFRDHQPDMEAYRAYLHGQVREICSNYGQLDVLWFDFSYDEMTGEAWAASDLIAMVRELQPTAIIDNRLETSGSGHGSLTTDDPLPWAGDFVSPEQVVPARGIVDPSGRPVPWEACITLNNNWGYAVDDHEWKSSKSVVRKLVECVAKNGNMLLNVGPDAEGVIPEGSQTVLREVGEWMAVHAESIRGCGAAGIDKPEWGWYTRNGNTVYAHVFDQPWGPLALTGIPKERVVSVRNLTTGGELEVSSAWSVSAYPDITFVQLGSSDVGTFALPDDTDTVVEITLS